MWLRRARKEQYEWVGMARTLDGGTAERGAVEAPEMMLSAFAREILEYVRQRPDGVTFVKLQADFGQRALGQSTMSYGTLVLWTELSEEMIAALNELVADRDIAIVPCEVDVYRAEGKGLDLKVASKGNRYLKPRWMPVLIVPQYH